MPAGGGVGRAWGGDLTFFKNLQSNSLPTGRSFQSNAEGRFEASAVRRLEVCLHFKTFRGFCQVQSTIQKENAQRFTKKSEKIISGQECGQRFNEKCLGMIAELQSNIDQTLMRAEAQKEKHKRMYPFAKETFVSKKRRVKENKAKARKRRRERAEKNCERVFSAISHSSSYGEVITSDHCSVIGLNNLTKRDGRWLKLLISKGKFTVDAIETIRANVSPVVLSAIDDSDDDEDDDNEKEDEEEEDGNASEGDGNGEDD